MQFDIELGKPGIYTLEDQAREESSMHIRGWLAAVCGCCMGLRQRVKVVVEATGHFSHAGKTSLIAGVFT